MAGIRRTHGAPAAKVDPLTTEQLTQMIATLDLDTSSGLRDRAILLFGYAGAFRRSELMAITRRQLNRTVKGYRVDLLRTKDDQEAKGRPVGIPAFANSPLCPVAAADAWLTAAQIEDGPIFRRVDRHQHVGSNPLSPASVPFILKRMATAAGIPPDRIAGHSLRAGHATTAAMNGAPDRSIMNQTGHEKRRHSQRIHPPRHRLPRQLRHLPRPRRQQRHRNLTRDLHDGPGLPKLRPGAK